MAKLFMLLMTKLFALFLLIGLQVQAQDTSYVRQATAPSLDADATFESTLLPNKMLFTQRVFWGPNGLLRVARMAPLTQEGREKERKVRQFMLIAHKATGYVTLAGFVAQGILELTVNNATGRHCDQLLTAQQTVRTITNITYGTTALLSLTAPPKVETNGKARSGIKLHKYLSIIHLTGFIATNILANQAPRHSELKPYRQAAGLTTLAAFAPALIALKF